jgi:hypothetical protein
MAASLWGSWTAGGIANGHAKIDPRQSARDQLVVDDRRSECRAADSTADEEIRRQSLI